MESVKLMSLDIWDTVLRRKCHPDAVKKATARYFLLRFYNQIKPEYRDIQTLFNTRIDSERAIGAAERGKGFDDEYYIKDVFSEAIRNACGIYTPADMSRIVEELYQFELEQEITSAYLDPGIQYFVERHSPDRLCYISDFYGDEEFIEHVINANAPSLKFDAGYSSCKLKYNKRSGRLYDIVQGQERVPPQNWLHVGDNDYSDVSVSRQKGINAIHYLPTEEHTKRQRLNQIFESPESFGEEAERIAVSSVKDGGIEQLGARYGIFFFSYVLWIIEECIKNGISHVYYFTREGEFFKGIHDIIAERNPYGVEMPHAHILEVSRKSTFCASLNEISIDEMMRLWNQYSVQSPEALLKSLDIPTAQLKHYFERYHLEMDREIIYPWQNENIQSLFQDSDFLKAMGKIVNEKRENIMKYFSAKGIGGKDDFAIVDIGWRGTIQDNLCHLLPGSSIHGYYIGLIPFLNEQPVNAEKTGFINGSPLLDEILKSCTPFEMVCNSPGGSTLRYQDIDGVSTAIRDVDKDENLIYHKFTYFFQKGVYAAAESLCPFANLQGAVHSDFYEAGVREMHRFITRPERELALAFFQLRHNEEFGVGEYVDKRTRFRPVLFALAVFSGKKREELKQFLNRTSWPQGYLVKYRLYPLLKVYNRILKRYVKK